MKAKCGSWKTLFNHRISAVEGKNKVGIWWLLFLTLLSFLFKKVEAQAFQYLGCFMDQSARNMIHQSDNNQCGTTNILQNCYTQCAGYRFFALQDGNQCFCGNSYGVPNDLYAQIPDAICGSSCIIQSTAVQGSCCGSGWTNAVFTVAIGNSSFDVTQMKTIQPEITTQTVCPGFVSSLGSCYFLTSPDSWANALSACRAMGGDLATINSAPENYELAIYFAQTVWIGMQRAGPYDHYVTCSSSLFSWVDGSPSVFSNWYSTEPSCGPNGGWTCFEGCGSLESNGRWNDLPCNGCRTDVPGLCLLQTIGNSTSKQTTAKTVQPEITSQAVCPGFMSSLGNCYFLTPPDSWTNALSTCRAMGGDLATINSAPENYELAIYFAQTLWIGMQRAGPYDHYLTCSSSLFSWIDGSSSVYSNWYSTEPNCMPNGGLTCFEGCGSLESNGLWNDLPCNGCRTDVPGLCQLQTKGNSMSKLTIEKTAQPMPNQTVHLTGKSTTKVTQKKTAKPTSKQTIAQSRNSTFKATQRLRKTEKPSLRPTGTHAGNSMSKLTATKTVQPLPNQTVHLTGISTFKETKKKTAKPTSKQTIAQSENSTFKATQRLRKSEKPSVRPTGTHAGNSMSKLTATRTVQPVPKQTVYLAVGKPTSKLTTMKTVQPIPKKTVHQAEKSTFKVTPKPTSTKTTAQTGNSTFNAIQRKTEKPAVRPTAPYAENSTSKLTAKKTVQPIPKQTVHLAGASTFIVTQKKTPKPTSKQTTAHTGNSTLKFKEYQRQTEKLTLRPTSTHAGNSTFKATQRKTGRPTLRSITTHAGLSTSGSIVGVVVASCIVAFLVGFGLYYCNVQNKAPKIRVQPTVDVHQLSPAQPPENITHSVQFNLPKGTLVKQPEFENIIHFQMCSPDQPQTPKTTLVSPITDGEARPEPALLPRGKIYHGFVSHKKETNHQLAMHIRDYLDLGYQMKIFFDVDDLRTKEITSCELEKAVEHSCVLLVLLDDQVLESVWCRYEWQCALKYQVPIVGIFNTDTFNDQQRKQICSDIQNKGFEYVLKFRIVELSATYRKVGFTELAQIIKEHSS